MGRTRRRAKRKLNSSGCEGGRVKPMAGRTSVNLAAVRLKRVDLLMEPAWCSCARFGIAEFKLRAEPSGPLSRPATRCRFASLLAYRSRAHECSSARAQRQCDERNERKKGFEVRRHILVARDSGPCV